MTIGSDGSIESVGLQKLRENFRKFSHRKDLNNGAAVPARFPGNESLRPESSISQKKAFCAGERSRKSRRLLAFVGLAYIPITRIKTSVQQDMVVRNVRKSRSQFARVPREGERAREKEGARTRGWGGRERQRERASGGKKESPVHMGGFTYAHTKPS